MNSLRAYADHRGVTSMAVSLAIKNGRLVKCVVHNAKGQPKISDFAVADQEWLDNTEHIKLRKPQGEDVDNATKLAKHWDAQTKELKFRELAGELIPVHKLRTAVSDSFSACREALLAIPTRARQDDPTLTQAQLVLIEELIRECLESLSLANVEHSAGSA